MPFTDAVDRRATQKVAPNNSDNIFPFQLADQAGSMQTASSINPVSKNFFSDANRVVINSVNTGIDDGSSLKEIIAGAEKVLGRKLTSQEKLLTEIYKGLIETNTEMGTPEGNTLIVAQTLAKRFEKAGIPAGDIHIVQPKDDKGNVIPNTGNLVVRQRGNGKGDGSILVFAHTDKVDADPKNPKWQGLDPRKVNIRDGNFVARGSVDDMAQAAVFASLIEERAEAAKAGKKFDRDLVAVFSSHEEQGGFEGMGYLINDKESADWILGKTPAERPIVAFTEGGYGATINGQKIQQLQYGEKEFDVLEFSAANTEKSPQFDLNSPPPANTRYEVFKITAKGKDSHAAWPPPTDVNSINRAAHAVLQLSDGEFSPESNENSGIKGYVSKFIGGTAKNQVPATADAWFVAQVPAGASTEEVRKKLSEKINNPNVVVTSEALDTYKARPASQDQNVVKQLAKTITQISDINFPLEVTDEVIDYFKNVAKYETPEMRAALQNFVAGSRDPDVLRIIRNKKDYNPILGTTAAVTQVNSDNNKLYVNPRILPGRPIDSARKIIAAVIGSNVTMKSLFDSGVSPPTKISPALRKTVADIHNTITPGVPDVPYLLPGGSDGRFTRSQTPVWPGINTVGIGNVFLDADENGMHNPYEFISIKDFYDQRRFFQLLLEKLDEQEGI
jgi:acetylornithine deacetylase/succinyl-diaminopimelate desuccinylase-like protein